tara:strand:- start:271 stop:645 length:375 start_codon:yes stop_codon:yes gene_type:complete
MKSIQVKGKAVLPKKKSYVGTVISTKMNKAVVVSWERRIRLPKFERYQKRRTKVHARVPDEMNLVEGDIVKVQETRPLSKTIHFIVTEQLGKEKLYEHKKEAQEEAKVPKEEDESDQSQDNEGA